MEENYLLRLFVYAMLNFVAIWTPRFKVLEIQHRPLVDG